MSENTIPTPEPEPTPPELHWRQYEDESEADFQERMKAETEELNRVNALEGLPKTSIVGAHYTMWKIKRAFAEKELDGTTTNVDRGTNWYAKLSNGIEERKNNPEAHRFAKLGSAILKAARFPIKLTTAHYDRREEEISNKLSSIYSRYEAPVNDQPYDKIETPLQRSARQRLNPTILHAISVDAYKNDPDAKSVTERGKKGKKKPA